MQKKIAFLAAMLMMVLSSAMAQVQLLASTVK